MLCLVGVCEAPLGSEPDPSRLNPESARRGLAPHVSNGSQMFAGSWPSPAVALGPCGPVEQRCHAGRPLCAPGGGSHPLASLGHHSCEPLPRRSAEVPAMVTGHSQPVVPHDSAFALTLFLYDLGRRGWMFL